LEERDLHGQDYHIFDQEVPIGEEEEQTGEMSARRDQIAREMWEDYQQVVMQRGLDDSEDSENDLVVEELSDDIYS
jgi:hypothetical protein